MTLSNTRVCRDRDIVSCQEWQYLVNQLDIELSIIKACEVYHASTLSRLGLRLGSPLG